MMMKFKGLIWLHSGYGGKNSKLVEFENSGHLPWLDNPDKHASLIKEFLVN